MRVVIIGAGSTSEIVSEIILSNRDYTLVGIVGSKEEAKKYKEVENKTINSIPFLGDRAILSELPSLGVNSFIVAIGDNYIREKIFYEAISKGLKAINAISRNTIIDKNVNIGSGTIIKSGTIISKNTLIGDNCLIDNGVIIETKCNVLNNCNINSGAVIGSNSQISKNVEIGIRSVISKEIHIGKNQKIKPNEVVYKNLPDLFRPNHNAK